MNYNLITYGGGGIFSLFMDLILPNMLYLHDIDGVNITIGKNQLDPDPGCFNHVFNQQHDNSYIDRACSFIGSISDVNAFIPLIDYFQIRHDVLSRLPSLSNTIGVHIRISDMNKRHPEYGVFGFNDFIRKIDIALSEHPDIEKIFVASDNTESIYKLIKIYGDKIIHHDFIRGANEQSDTYKIQFDNASNPTYWQEAFIDMLSLSRCDYLVCRRSNLSKAAVLYSKTIKKTYDL